MYVFYCQKLKSIWTSSSKELGNNSSNLIVNGECEGHIEDDTGQTRANTLVETTNTLVSEDVAEGASEAAILGSLKRLKVGLDHINGVVEHNRAETSKSTREEVAKNLPLNVI
jgi:hypothetical protein